MLLVSSVLGQVQPTTRPLIVYNGTPHAEVNGRACLFLFTNDLAQIREQCSKAPLNSLVVHNGEGVPDELRIPIIDAVHGVGRGLKFAYWDATSERFDVSVYGWLSMHPELIPANMPPADAAYIVNNRPNYLLAEAQLRIINDSKLWYLSKCDYVGWRDYKPDGEGDWTLRPIAKWSADEARRLCRGDQEPLAMVCPVSAPNGTDVIPPALQRDALEYAGANRNTEGMQTKAEDLARSITGTTTAATSVMTIKGFYAVEIDACVSEVIYHRRDVRTTVICNAWHCTSRNGSETFDGGFA